MLTECVKERKFIDEETGAHIRQVTDAACINHHPFFMIPAYSKDMRKLFFISHRTGTPQIFCEDRMHGEIVQLTDIESLNEWSVHPSPDGRFVYYTAGASGYRFDMVNGRQELLPGIGGIFRTDSDVTVGMGTTALSADGRLWAVKCLSGGESIVVVLDTASKGYRTVLVSDEVSHMQFCPWNSRYLFYAGKLTDRVWLLDIETGNTRRLFRRDEANKQWITHETFIPGRREISLVDWNKGVLAVDPVTGAVRRIVEVNAWHAVSDSEGEWMIADTNFPDIGIILFRADRTKGPYLKVCNSCSSNQGAHWAGPFPYDNGPIKVHAPQHTHPHPSFSPDGNFAVFTSDRTGFSQVYEVDLREIKRKFMEEYL